MTLYRVHAPVDLVGPTLVVAFEGWVDAGSAATAAAEQLAPGGSVLASFEVDRLFDYRVRRPVLEIVDGRLAELTWPELAVRHARLGERDVLVLSGHEPDYHWRELIGAMLELIERLGVSEWISLGAIPAAVPHSRPVPVLGTAARPELLRGGIQPGPSGIMRVPAALVSVLELEVARAGIPAVGYFAQVPHYVSGPYPGAAVELLRAVGRHLGVEVSYGELEREAQQVRTRLDTAVAADETSSTYVTRLEAMVDESRLPAGDDLIADIERFLRERNEGPQRS